MYLQFDNKWIVLCNFHNQALCVSLGRLHKVKQNIKRNEPNINENKTNSKNET